MSQKSKSVISVQTASEYEKLISSGLVIVDYNTVWCGPCRKFAPIFEEIAKANPGIVFLSVDAEAINHYDCTSISNIPTFKVFLNGTLKRDFSGVDRERLEKYIDRYRIQILVNGKVKRTFDKDSIEKINKYMENITE